MQTGRKNSGRKVTSESGLKGILTASECVNEAGWKQEYQVEEREREKSFLIERPYFLRFIITDTNKRSLARASERAQPQSKLTTFY